MVSQRESSQNSSNKAAAFIGKSHTKPNKFTGRCYKCGKRGHRKSECKNRQPTEANLSSSKSESNNKSVCFVSNVAKDVENKCVWILDSGSSEHLINDESYFCSFKSLNMPLKINVAKENQSMEATKVGSINAVALVQTKSIPIEVTNVLFVPDLRCNLLSVKALTRAGVEVNFSRNGAVL